MTNPADRFQRDFTARLREIRDAIDRRILIKAGQIGKRFVQDNFRKGGFVNNGLHPWTPSKRLSQGGTSAASKKGTLLSSSTDNSLFASTGYRVGKAQVTIFNDKVYAEIHNSGGKVSVPVTAKMRRLFWWRYYDAIGDSRPRGKKKGKGKKVSQANEPEKNRPEENKEASMWKGLALTKKNHLQITLPKRTFLDDSKELREDLAKMIETELFNLFNR